ncbi:MAG: rod shape-determining protein MreD [Planctomycetota bacterium]|nr:rod shape-determining protein MreD [Planctomycetota bacterium]MDP7251323.1 rod shape-determining protein MreD [Planctomycetota bacterium]
MAQLTIALFIFLGLLLQTSVFGFLPILGARPDLLMALLVFLALYSDDGAWPLRYWFVGLGKDICSAGPPGLYALTFMLVGILIHRMRKDIYRELWSTRIWLVFMGVVVANGSAALSQALSFGNYRLLEIAAGVFLEAAYSALAAPLFMLMLLFCRFFLRIPKRELSRAI